MVKRALAEDLMHRGAKAFVDELLEGFEGGRPKTSPPDTTTDTDWVDDILAEVEGETPEVPEKDVKPNLREVTSTPGKQGTRLSREHWSPIRRAADDLLPEGDTLTELAHEIVRISGRTFQAAYALLRAENPSWSTILTVAHALDAPVGDLANLMERYSNVSGLPRLEVK